MAKCKTCGEYYKKSRYNQTEECDSCVDQLVDVYYDEEDEVEIQHLLHPNGKTPARYYD